MAKVELRRFRFYSALCDWANKLDRFMPWMSTMYVVVVKQPS